MNHVILYAGSEIMVLAVKNILEQNNIPYIIRNDIDSSITAGFVSADNAVNVLVEQKDLEKAEQLLIQNDIK
ncbi:putative signal transducing protein [Myroides sp. LJL119]